MNEPRGARVAKVVLEDGRTAYGFVDLNSETHRREGDLDIYEFTVALTTRFKREGGAA